MKALMTVIALCGAALPASAQIFHPGEAQDKAEIHERSRKFLQGLVNLAVQDGTIQLVLEAKVEGLDKVFDKAYDHFKSMGLMSCSWGGLSFSGTGGTYTAVLHFENAAKGGFQIRMGAA